MSLSDRELQDLQVLAGTRRHDSRGKAAVRREDLRGLRSLPAKPKSTKAAEYWPTKVEFDALVEDLHEIHSRLRAMAGAASER